MLSRVALIFLIPASSSSSERDSSHLKHILGPRRSCLQNDIIEVLAKVPIDNALSCENSFTAFDCETTLN